jgi:hypothetical protein
MDDVERMYRHLVRTIRASFPPYLSQPFEVGELYQTILPYRLHRRELGLETNQDYELALMELLSGDRGYLIVDGKMRDALAAEVGAPSPNTGRIRDFASEHVALAPEALQRLDAASRASESRPPSGASGVTSRAALSTSERPSPGGASPTVAMATVDSGARASGGDASRRAARPITVAAGDVCPLCKGELPAGRQVSFCPHCGQDVTLVHCPACGSELERGWKFCVTCGRGADVVKEAAQ